MSWTARESTSNYQGIATWDSYATDVAVYSATATWPSACNVINKVVLLALKGAFPGPQFVQSKSSASARFLSVPFATWTIAFDNPVAAGNCIVVDILYGSAGINGITITDSLGNTYKPVIAAHYPFQTSYSLACFVAPASAAGANTLTITQTGSTDFTSIAVAIHEYSGLSGLLPTGTPPANFGFYTDTTGVSDAVSDGINPSEDVFTLSVTTSVAGDLLHFVAGSDPFCAGVIASGGGGHTPLPGPGPPGPTPPPFTQRGNIDYDQIRASVRSGPGLQFLMYGGAAPGTPGDVVVFDSLGNAIGAGGPPGSIITTAIKFTASWSAQTSVTVHHNLGTATIIFGVYDASGIRSDPQSATITSPNVLTLTFGVAFTGSIVVLGFQTGQPSQKYTTSWTAQTSVTVNHNLGTTQVFVQVYSAAGLLVTPQSIVLTSANVVTLGFGASFTGAVVVIALAPFVRQASTSWTAQTSVTFNHALNTSAVIVQVYDGAGKQVEPQRVTVTDDNNVTLTFAPAFTGIAIAIG